MKTFEYSVLRLNNNYSTETKIAQLSQVGEDGWELITVLPGDTASECFFKREIDTVAEQAKEKLDEAIGAIKTLAGNTGQGLGDMFSGGFPKT